MERLSGTIMQQHFRSRYSVRLSTQCAAARMSAMHGRQIVGKMVCDVDTAAKATRCLAITMVCACCAACTTTQVPAKYSSKGYSSEKVYGAKASPQVSHRKQVRKGGGRYVVGKPYLVKGKRYYPKEDPNYDRKGLASWYGSAFHGHPTANGEIFDKEYLSAAHPTLPLPSYVRVTNLENGSSLILRVNDRGPYHKGRILDVSSKAADMLDLKHRGTASVRVQYIGRARLDGRDMPYLMASYAKKGGLFRFNPELQIGTGVMVASTQSTGVHLRRNRQAPWTGQKNLAGDPPSVSYRAAAAAAFRTVEQLQTLPGIGPIIFEGPAPWMSQNAEIASLDDERGLGRIGMIGHNAKRADLGYCWDEDSDGGDACEVQVLPLPGIDRTKRLTNVTFIKRRRARLRAIELSPFWCTKSNTCFPRMPRRHR